MQFNFIQPESLNEAIKLSDNAHIYAGGTDMLGLLKDEIIRTKNVINLKNIKGLDNIEDRGSKGIEIGSLVKIADLIENKTIQEKCPLLWKTAKEIASPQLRNMGTVGGNICQRPRCWYFRGDFNCFRKDGDTCYAVGGENKYHCIIGGGPCYIVHPSDLAVSLLALDAEIEIASKDGKKTVRVNDFFILPEDDETKENILKPGQVITKIIIPKLDRSLKSAYIKFKERASWDFAIVSVAAILETDDKTIKKGKLAFGGIAPRPWMDLSINNKLNGLKTDEISLDIFITSLFKNAEPMEKNEYKVILTRNLVKRVIENI